MMLSAAFGIALVWLSAPLVKRGTQRIDRAFFRSAYDARVILQDLAEKTRTVTDRTELAALLEHHLNKALRPKTFACYVGAHDSQLVAQSGFPGGSREAVLRSTISCPTRHQREILGCSSSGL